MVILKERPVYLLAGTEHFLKEDALGKIKSAFLDESSRSFNFNVFYAGSAGVEKILECARTFPVFGSKRVVLVRGFENFSISERQLILSYVKTPQRVTCLVLETRENNLNEKFFAELCKFSQVIFCNPPSGNHLFDWISARAKTEGKKIEKKALQLMVENLGSNLQALALSLEGLILYIGKRETISAADVERLVGPDITAGVFELVYTLRVRDKQKTFQVLDSLLKNGVSAPQILGALGHKIISEKNRMDLLVFERYLLDLQRTDADIKRGRQPQRMALELLMARLLHLF